MKTLESIALVRQFLACWALTLGLMTLTSSGASAITLLSENFEGLSRGPYASPTEIPSAGGQDWTDQLPANWQMTFSGPLGNPIEFQGWRVHNVDSWIATEEDQGRSTWSNPGVGQNGAVLLVDPDAYDDGTNIDVGLFNSWITTPPVDLSGITPGSVKIAFDSFWRSEVTQIGTLDVSFDGGVNYENLLTYDSNLLTSGAIIDQREIIDIDNPGSGTMLFRFGMTEASNNWWWAIDNVEVFSKPVFAVQVDRATGNMTFSGDPSTSLATQGYSLTSPSGALNSDLWRPISATADANSGGGFDPTANWVRFTADGARNDLSEGVLGTTNIAGGKTHDMGDAVWIRYPVEDLELRYLDATGVQQIGTVLFTGNDGQPFPLADLTFDGQLDAADWLAFQAGLGGEFPTLSIAESYQLGDLNGDLETNHADFQLFMDAFDAANGNGAFRTLLENIPEPAGLLLLLVGWPLVLGARRNRMVAGGMLFLVPMILCSSFVSTAEAQVLFVEDFEGLNLIDSDLASDGNGDTDWTDVGPAGWMMDDRGTPQNPDRPEFQGWTYLDKAFWLDQQGTQVGRADFLPQLSPNNTIAVADPDAHDDFINNDPNLFSAALTTPAISLAGVGPGSVRVSFDSTWVPEDLQEGHFNVVFDGVRTNVFTWDSENNANFKPAATNEHVEISLNNPAGTTQMQLEWDMVEAGNDWWWAIDNVLVEATPATQFLSLVVNPATGATRIQNETGSPVEINYYEIHSPGRGTGRGRFSGRMEQPGRSGLRCQRAGNWPKLGRRCLERRLRTGRGLLAGQFNV